MNTHHEKDHLLDDISARQRNVVFPDTVQNEALFWRNLGTTPWNTSTKIGLAILAIFVFGLAGVFLTATIQGGITWVVILATLLLFGPVFGVIAWATRRNLRNIQSARRKR